jgi:hypothetical protein
MSNARTLREALDALTALATTAGLDPASARAEGEALAATVAEPARGAYVDWCTETGHSTAEDFTSAASRGRRYRVAQTPAMASLASAGSAHAAAYAQALSDVALAGSFLGEENARSIGNAATAAAAQLVRDPSVGLNETTSDPVQTAPPPEPEVPKEEPAAPEPPAKTVEELLAELDDLVGLTDVKAEIHRQAAVLRVEGLRADAGLEGLTITRHLIFNGNPGTGKTTVARLVAGIYRALGLLSQGQLVEVDRSELVAGYLGQTAMKTAEVVKSAIGGVLFIDEAYSLAGDQYGQEAIDTLVKEMEDHRGDLVVIVAGYPLPMAVFIGQNPGLESRFRTEINFPDYTDDELVSIFEVMASGAQYDAGAGVQDRLRELLAQVERGPSFGNARYVRNVLEAAIGRHAWRLREVDSPTLEQLRLLLPEDISPPAEVVEPFDVPIETEVDAAEEQS